MCFSAGFSRLERGPKSDAVHCTWSGIAGAALGMAFWRRCAWEALSMWEQWDILYQADVSGTSESRGGNRQPEQQ